MGTLELTAIMGAGVFLIVAIAAGWAFSSRRKPHDPSKNLRKLNRFASSNKVTLSWRGANNVTKTLKCRLIDISENSAGVRSKMALGLGTYLYISIPALRLATTANVRRCSAAGLKFDLGLEFRGPLYRDCHRAGDLVKPSA